MEFEGLRGLGLGQGFVRPGGWDEGIKRFRVLGIRQAVWSSGSRGREFRISG